MLLTFVVFGRLFLAFSAWSAFSIVFPPSEVGPPRGNPGHRYLFYVGHGSCAGFGTAGRASLIMNLLLLLGLLFAGFLVNTASIGPALGWVHYLSVFFYGFESLTTNEISGTEFRFTVGGPDAFWTLNAL